MNLNLLPSQAKFQAARIKLKANIKKFLIILGAVWVSIILAVVVTWVVINTKVTNSNKKYSDVAKKYASLSQNVILSERLKYQAKLVGKILNERFEYSVPLKQVDSLFSSKITVDKFEIRDQSRFAISGSFSGNKNMDEIEDKAKQINSGLIDGFSGAKITTLTTAAGLWKFEMEVTIK